MIDMHWERVEMITNENGRLAKEQPELDKLKRQHIPLRMVREMQKDEYIDSGPKSAGRLVTGMLTGLIAHIRNYM